MNKISLILFALFILRWSAGHSQAEEIHEAFRNDGHDTSYIKDFHESLVLKTYIVNKSNDFTISNKENEITADYKPNDGANLGFGVNYKAFGISLAFIPLGKRNNSKYGKTSKLDFQANMYTRKFGFDFRLQSYNGFYLSNASSINPNIGTDSIFPQRPDISTLSMGGSVFYVFNSNRFSFKNTFTNNEWQKKSSGSFFAGNNLSVFQIKADSAIAPTTIIDSINQAEYVQNFSVLSIGGFGGYAYTYVFAKHFFLTGAFAPGLATVNIDAQNGLGETVSTGKARIALQLKSRVGLGYNSDKLFGGVSGIWDYSSFNYGNEVGDVGFTTGSIRVYLGIRFLN